MLRRLYADNYKCLVGFEFRPASTQLVIGRNGTGKSAVFDVLSALRDFSIRGVPFDQRLGGNTLTRWRPEVEEQHFELDVRLGTSDFSYQLHVEDHPLHSPRINRVNREAVSCDGQPVFIFENGTVHLFNDRFEDKVQYPFDWTRSALSTVQERKENTKLSAFRRWLRDVVHVQIDPWAMTSRSEEEARYPDKNLGNFAEWYRHLLLDDAKAVLDALTALKTVMPSFLGLDAKEAGLNVRVLRAAFRTDTEGEFSITFADLSEGQRALIALYVTLYSVLRDGSTLLIDEPDNFVALAEIQPWLMQLLDRVDEENAQVIVASHHPEILNQLAARNGAIFERPGGGPTRARPFDATDDSGLTPAEVIARGWESA